MKILFTQIWVVKLIKEVTETLKPIKNKKHHSIYHLKGKDRNQHEMET